MNIIATECRGDALCRCRDCKPAFSCLAQIDPRKVPSNRVVIGSTGLAIIIAVLTIMGAR